jgi:hypothetical protein
MLELEKNGPTMSYNDKRLSTGEANSMIVISNVQSLA